jgi:hypothetical protein
MRRVVPVAIALTVAASCASTAAARVLRVGTYKGRTGQFSSIQAAVDAAKPGDWILVGPGDYKEQGIRGASEPAGVLIRTSRLHVRGMDRNRVIVDGTKAGTAPCSSRPRDQVVTKKGRDGIVAFKASGVYIENLTACNFLTNKKGEEGNEIWWNGGDGSGKIGMGSWWGNYITATSTFSRGVNPPYGDYGIFVSNSRGPGIVDHSYASNMGDGAYYIGACPECNAVLTHAHAQNSSLGYSGTNSGGHLIIENSEFDHNKAGPTTNSQNNDDAPSPQNGACPDHEPGPLGNGICEIWRNNTIHDNNNANVPGNGVGGVAGDVPVGTGAVLGGSENVELLHNRIFDNNSWGVVVTDFPDQEKPPSIAHCEGGDYLTPPPAANPLCYYHAFGNVISKNAFANNGSFRNPTDGDIILYAQPRTPGNCFNGNTNPGGLASEPAGIQSPPFSTCGVANGSTSAAATLQLGCALKLTSCPPDTKYPEPSRTFKLALPSRQATMPNPCTGVPRNPWCPTAVKRRRAD